MLLTSTSSSTTFSGRDLDGLQKQFQHLVADLGGLLGLRQFSTRSRRLVFSSSTVLELAGQLREVVVEFGELTHLDRVDGDGDVCVLTGDRPPPACW